MFNESLKKEMSATIKQFTADEVEKIRSIIHGCSAKISKAKNAILLLDDALTESLDDMRVRQIQRRIERNRAEIVRWTKTLSDLKTHILRKREHLKKKTSEQRGENL